MSKLQMTPAESKNPIPDIEENPGQSEKSLRSSRSCSHMSRENSSPMSKRYRYTIANRNGESKHSGNHLEASISESGFQGNMEEAVDRTATESKAVTVLTWAQCDLCSKWRQLPTHIRVDQSMSFSCKDVKGCTCDTPEDEAVGQVDLNSNPRSISISRKASPAVPAQPSTGVSDAACPTCGLASSALEEHYRISPLCRPNGEVTPYWVSGLVLDLSDRIPYRAVIHKDLRIWKKFSSRARSCSSYRGAAKQLLWFFEQLRPAVLCQSWREKRKEGFRKDCEGCDDAQLSVQLVNEVEQEAIDWVEIHRLWAEERGLEPPTCILAPTIEKNHIRPGLASHSKSAKGSVNHKNVENERMKRRRAALARWDRCKVARETTRKSQHARPTADAGGACALEALESSCDKNGSKILLDGENSATQHEAGSRHNGDEAYTLGSLVQVTLDDGEQALAIITALPDPSHPQDTAHEVTFLDARGLIVADDRLRLPLPNRFVAMALACPNCLPGALPSGWLPAAAGPSTCFFISPDGRVCRSQQEMLAYLASQSADESGAARAVVEPGNGHAACTKQGLG